MWNCYLHWIDLQEEKGKKKKKKKQQRHVIRRVPNIFAKYFIQLGQFHTMFISLGFSLLLSFYCKVLAFFSLFLLLFLTFFFYLDIIDLPKMDLFDQCWGNNDNRSYQVRGENDVRGIVGLM